MTLTDKQLKILEWAKDHPGRHDPLTVLFGADILSGGGTALNELQDMGLVDGVPIFVETTQAGIDYLEGRK